VIRPIVISTREELDYCLRKGVNPIFYHPIVKLDIKFRIYLQNELFGRPALSDNKIVIANDRFYRYCWENGHGLCENCGRPLYVLRNLDGIYSSVWISHILSRGGWPEYAHDPRNHNILCGRCHAKWESRYNFEMSIFFFNQRIIKEIKSEY
jgi:hypothetical protein